MRWPRRDTLIPLALGALAFVVAFAAAPGPRGGRDEGRPARGAGLVPARRRSARGRRAARWATSSPASTAATCGRWGRSSRSATSLGLPDWVVGRLWIGAALALSAWGMVRLLDALAGRPRGAGHLAGGLLYMLNPYVVTYVGRTSITLLATAALPWLLLCVHRGLRDPRGWWWPAAFALVLTSTGGGVNVAVTAWLLLGPALLVVYELGWGAVASGAARGFVVRLVPVAALASPVVGRGRARPRALRPGLPALHRAAGDDLEHDVAARVAAAAGLLDELHRRRLHGHAARLPGRRRRLPGARRRSCWRRWPSPRCAWGRSRGRGARATRRSSSRSSSSACW